MNQNVEQPDFRYLDAANRLGLLCQGPAAGVAYWQPAGQRLYSRLKQFILSAHEKEGYLEVRTPSLASIELFAQSGHLDRYRENMFFVNQPLEVGEAPGGYALRPMSCPNHIVLYKGVRRSYRELPLRFFEFGEVFRNEPSGSLQSLFRQRQFCQDDSHVFVAENQLVVALSGYLRMAAQVYQALGFENVSYAISLRPEKRFGDDAHWDRAEEALRHACRENGIDWKELPGEGAFYGPKVELQVRDKLGRAWQLGTLQLDYVLPRRFNLGFINAQGHEEVPVLLHHAVLGSLERMIGILLESFGVHLPERLHPYEAVVVPVSNKVAGYAQACAERLRARWPGIHEDLSQDPLGAKLRGWKQKGCPNIFVVGEKEAEKFEKGEGMCVALDGKLVLVSALQGC